MTPVAVGVCVVVDPDSYSDRRAVHFDIAYGVVIRVPDLQHDLLAVTPRDVISSLPTVVRYASLSSVSPDPTPAFGVFRRYAVSRRKR